MQTNAIVKMNLQCSFFLVLYGTLATCQTEVTTEKVDSERNIPTTNKANYVGKENAKNYQEKKNTLTPPFNVAVIHSKNRAYSSKGESIVPIHPKIMHKRQSGMNKNSLNVDQTNPIENIYDTSELIYKPAIPRNRGQTSYFPYTSNTYDYKRNSDRENEYNVKRSRFEDGGRWDGPDSGDFESSWKSFPNSPYVDFSDRHRPLHEPNRGDLHGQILDEKLAGK